MRKRRFFPVMFPIIFIIIMFMFAVPAYATDNTQTGSIQYEVVGAESEEDAVAQLEAKGFIPVYDNIAEHDEQIKDKVVMVGYKYLSEEEARYAGSVFGSSKMVMICGIGVIAGVIIGMLSMKIKRVAKENEDEKKKI